MSGTHVRCDVKDLSRSEKDGSTMSRTHVRRDVMDFVKLRRGLINNMENSSSSRCN